MKEFIITFLRVFYPEYCPLCDEVSRNNTNIICTKCTSRLPLSYSWHSRDTEMYKKIEGKCVILNCVTLMLFENESITQKIIHEIKYNNRKELGLEFGRYFGVKLRETMRFNNIDYIIPLPLHPKKQKQRGYNQSYWIAKGIADELGIELCNDTVKRVVNNPTQTKLSISERVKNVKGIFKVYNQKKLRGKKLLIVDDVCTSGSTISSIVSEINAQTEGSEVSVAILATVL